MLKMKKILILSNAMEIGGAERALLGLLNAFDYSCYSVDLFLCRHTGELYKEIPKEVNILPMSQARYLAVPMINLIKEKQWKILYGRLKAKFLAKRFVRQNSLSEDNQVELTYSHKYTFKYFDYINPDVEYDLAISFLTPHYICVNKCHSKVKVAWIHTDYSTIDIDLDTELEMWNKYDNIVSISDKCSEAFLLKMPILKEKIIRIDNIIQKEMILTQARKSIPVEIDRNGDELVFCSVGRFSYAKNFDNIPNICKRVLQKGIEIKWYLIGYGGDKNQIQSKIQEEKVERNVVILGKKENPYPYINACDFYIQPSRYEGKAVTVREAQVLGKPVIITNFPTATSQLIDGYDGKIVSLDNEKCADEIVSFIKDKKLVSAITKNIESTDYTNYDEINKIYALMGDYHV